MLNDRKKEILQAIIEEYIQNILTLKMQIEPKEEFNGEDYAE